MKKVEFVLNGKPSAIGGPSRQAKKVLDFVEAIPTGKYFDIEGVAKCLGTSFVAIDQLTRKHQGELLGHFLLVPGDSNGRKKIFGSKAGIEALKKKLQDAGLI